MEDEDFVPVLPRPRFAALHFLSMVLSQLLLRVGFTLLQLSLFSTGPCRPYPDYGLQFWYDFVFSGVNNYLPSPFL